MLERDQLYNDPLDRLDALEEEMDRRDVARPTEVVIVENPEWQQIAGWVSTGTVLRSVGGEIILDPTVPKIEVDADGYIQSADFVSGVAGFQIEGGTAEFNDVVVRGTIYATLGEVGGWVIGTHALTADSGAVGLNSEATGGTDWRIWAGDVMPGSAPFRVDESGNLVASSANIAGTIDANAGTLGTLEVDGVLTVGSATPRIQIDGPNKRIRSSNFSAGVDGFTIEGNGDAEFNNVTVRGSIEAAVLAYEAVQAQAGTLVVAPSAGKLLNDVTTVAAPTTFDLDIEDPAYGHAQLFAASDVLYLRTTSGTENWVTVSSVTDNGSYYTYTCTLSDGSGTTFYAGTPVVDYGQSGDGYLLLTADATNAPYYSVRTWVTNPWTGGNVTEAARLGNMNGAFGVSSDYWGFGVGDYAAGNYLKYDSNGGFIVKAGAGTLAIDTDGISLEVGTSWQSGAAIKFVDGSGDLLGSVYAVNTSIAGYRAMYVECDPDSATLRDVYVNIQSISPNSSYLAEVQLYATDGTDSARLELQAGALLDPVAKFSDLDYVWVEDAFLKVDGEIRQGGTDYGAYEIQTGGRIYANDYIVALGGLHVGGTSDPGTDNLVVDADARVGGGLYVGSTGTNPDADDICYDGDLRPVRGGKKYTGYAFVPLVAPETSTSWDGDAKSGGTQKIDISSAFGVSNTSAIKAYLVRFAVKDSAVANYAGLGGSGSGDARFALTVWTHASNVYTENSGIVPADSNGDIYFTAGAAVDGVFIQIFGYFV